MSIKERIRDAIDSVLFRKVVNKAHDAVRRMKTPAFRQLLLKGLFTFAVSLFDGDGFTPEEIDAIKDICHDILEHVMNEEGNANG